MFLRNYESSLVQGGDNMEKIEVYEEQDEIGGLITGAVVCNAGCGLTAGVGIVAAALAGGAIPAP